MARPRKNPVAVVADVAPSLFVETPFALSEEEREAILAIRSSRTAQAAAPSADPAIPVGDLAKALIQAIEATRPPEKKTTANRKKGNPWLPKDGSPKLKMKRTYYQHGMEIDPDTVPNEVIERLNKMKPGTYCGGWVKVKKTQSGGLNIDYPIRTSAQRLKLNDFYAGYPGETGFSRFLARLLDEKTDPAKYRDPSEDED